MIDQIIAYEQGELDDAETLELFSKLIKDGTAWQLQGSYGRQATHLLTSGIIDDAGIINWNKYNNLKGE